MKKIVLALGMLLMLSCSTDDALTTNTVEETTDATCSIIYRQIITMRENESDTTHDTIADQTHYYSKIEDAPKHLDYITFNSQITCGENKRDIQEMYNRQYILIRTTE